MRISDWSSDVCSSDLQHRVRDLHRRDGTIGVGAGEFGGRECVEVGHGGVLGSGDATLSALGRSRARLQGGCDGVNLKFLETFAWVARLKSFSLAAERSEEHTSELQSLMRISYAVFCLK